MNEVVNMAVTKCILKLSKASNLCDTLISKEFFVMISLIDEEQGLRVSDIHYLLGGNKSWVSNLCLRLSNAGLALSKKEGREVYYRLSKNGSKVAEKALSLILNLMEAEKINYVLSDNTFLLNKDSISGKQIQEFGKLGYPFFTHKGALSYSIDKKYLLFVGDDQAGRPLILEIPLKAIHNLENGFDDYYKRRYLPRPKPLIIDYKSSLEEDNLQRIYLFTQYHRITHSTKNSKWFTILLEEKESQIQEKKEKNTILKQENDMLPMIE